LESRPIHLRVRRRTLVLDATGHQTWRVMEEPSVLTAARTAVVLCDVWDRHWCRGANERLAAMVGPMNEVAHALRDRGALVVHAPSDTLAFYRSHPARRRALEAPRCKPPEDAPHSDPPLPVLVDDPTSCDTPPDAPARVWTRQHEGIDIDPARDVISDDGRELYAVYRSRDIRNVIILGVHANMCMLQRSFAIKQMVRWGFSTLLVRDLTDAQYSPSQWPYVTHDEGTHLVIAYIEAFWCGSISSEQLVR
jgi:nicotinamidase-related amidase